MYFFLIFSGLLWLLREFRDFLIFMTATDEALLAKTN